MKFSNHELAERYSIKAKMLGLNAINFRLKPNDNVEIVEEYLKITKYRS